MSKPKLRSSAMEDVYPETKFASFVPLVVRDFIVGHRKFFLGEVVPEIAEERSEYERQRMEQSVDHVLRILQLLAAEEEMREVYELLPRVFRRDEQWARFICAAVDASDDFRSEREFVIRAERLKTKIGETASKLYRLLMEMGDNAQLQVEDGINDHLDWPIELFCMRLQRRPLIDGERKRYVSRSRYIRRPLIIRPADVVSRLMLVADRWEPKPADGMGAAAVVLKSQKSIPKSQLIRSFWFELTTNTTTHPLIDDSVRLEWPRTSNLLKAVAATATIIWNHPDEVITYDDVKAAIKIFDRDKAADPADRGKISAGQSGKNLPE